MIKALQDTGHEVLRLRDSLPVESEDAAVISKAQELSAILLSLNGDFADIVAYPPPLFRGIVALQLRNRPQLTDALMQRLINYLNLYPSDEHYKGKLILVEVNRIRIRT